MDLSAEATADSIGKPSFLPEIILSCDGLRQSSLQNAARKKISHGFTLIELLVVIVATSAVSVLLLGITLEKIINELVQRHGWSEMGRGIPVRCFKFNPTVKSSLTFLRKTPWARAKVEDWFIAEL